MKEKNTKQIGVFSSKCDSNIEYRYKCAFNYVKDTKRPAIIMKK